MIECPNCHGQGILVTRKTKRFTIKEAIDLGDDWDEAKYGTITQSTCESCKGTGRVEEVTQ